MNAKRERFRPKPWVVIVCLLPSGLGPIFARNAYRNYQLRVEIESPAGDCRDGTPQ